MRDFEKTVEPAPEVFDREYKPSWLSSQFKIYAKEMVESDWASKKGDRVVPRDGLGLEFVYDREGEVELVLLASPNDPTHTVYEIKFTPPFPFRETYATDGSTVTFLQTFFSTTSGEVTKQNIFNRDKLGPGDAEVNEFFRDMAAAIHSKSDDPHINGLA